MLVVVQEMGFKRILRTIQRTNSIQTHFTVSILKSIEVDKLEQQDTYSVTRSYMQVNVLP